MKDLVPPYLKLGLWNEIQYIEKNESSSTDIYNLICMLKVLLHERIVYRILIHRSIYKWAYLLFQK